MGRTAIPDAIIVVNAGSSSIKFSVFLCAASGIDLALRGQVEGLFSSPTFTVRDASGTIVEQSPAGTAGGPGHAPALDLIIRFLADQGERFRAVAVGHRVVHGGLVFTHPVRLDAGVVKQLEELIPLAPLHQTHNLAPIRRFMERMPELPQVACFDTAFHSNQPATAGIYAIPSDLTEAGLRRYGFHGLSYEYIASILSRYDVRAAQGRTVVLHLGSGASMCAMLQGRSVATTMGFTALEGLPMGTRCGTLDPGLVLHLISRLGMDAGTVENMLYEKSGLLGISGVSSDMRELVNSSAPAARLALDYFVYRVTRELGSLAAALGGLDSVVFTAGVGENSPSIRERICIDAAWLGVDLDTGANSRGGPRISSEDSRVSAWVISTDEERIIAQRTIELTAAVHDKG